MTRTIFIRRDKENLLFRVEFAYEIGTGSKTLDAFLTLDLVPAGQVSNEPLYKLHISTGNFITVSLSAGARELS